MPTKNDHPRSNILAVREFSGLHGNKTVSMETDLARFFPCPIRTSLPNLAAVGP